MARLRITPTLSIDESALKESFIRADGPGGQNVNKVASAVQLRFDARHAPELPEAVRARLMRLAGSKMTGEGEIVIVAKRFRDQGKNRADARMRLLALLLEATIEPKIRMKTKPSRAERQRRLTDKKAQGWLKRTRSLGRGDVD